MGVASWRPMIPTVRFVRRPMKSKSLAEAWQIGL